jgi:hypothetical protein
LGASSGSIIYLRRNGFSLWPWADAAVPALGTGIMITRLGCYMYGCDFGRALPANAPGWLKTLGSFPHWHDNHGSPAWQQHVQMGFRATRQACESAYHGIWNSAENLCHIPVSASQSAPGTPDAALRVPGGLRRSSSSSCGSGSTAALRARSSSPSGFSTASAGRLLEIIRDDAERGTVGNLSTSQFIGLASLLVAVPAYLYLRKNAPPAKGVDLFAPVPKAEPEATAA